MPRLVELPDLLDHPEDPTTSFWKRLDRRRTQPAQARSIWSRPGRHKAPGHGPGGQRTGWRSRLPAGLATCPCSRADQRVLAGEASRVDDGPHSRGAGPLGGTRPGGCPRRRCRGQTPPMGAWVDTSARERSESGRPNPRRRTQSGGPEEGAACLFSGWSCSSSASSPRSRFCGRLGSFCWSSAPSCGFWGRWGARSVAVGTTGSSRRVAG
jgi:hypothetical protein